MRRTVGYQHDEHVRLWRDRIARANRIVAEMVALLPPPGADYPVSSRLCWLRAVSAVLLMAHGRQPDVICIDIATS